jgi:hypothetical protein
MRDEDWHGISPRILRLLDRTEKWRPASRHRVEIHGIASANNAFKKGPALDTDESFSLIGEGRMNGHHNGNGYKGWARRQARRRNGHG